MGHKHSENTKKKIGLLQRGHSHTEATKRKIGKAQRGEKSHFWKGGISFKPYTIDWTDTLKRAIRERDYYICQVCNHYGNSVHHIDYNKENCNPNNLIILCRSCHNKTQFNRNKWIKFFFDLNRCIY